MRHVKSLILACGLALGLLAAANSSEAKAADNLYRVVCINNPTDLPMVYAFRWGDTSEWKMFTLQPGEKYTHSMAYDYPNQGFGPVPQIMMVTDLTNPKASVEVFNLKANGAPTRDS